MRRSVFMREVVEEFMLVCKALRVAILTSSAAYSPTVLCKTLLPPHPQEKKKILHIYLYMQDFFLYIYIRPYRN